MLNESAAPESIFAKSRGLSQSELVRQPQASVDPQPEPSPAPIENTEKWAVAVAHPEAQSSNGCPSAEDTSDPLKSNEDVAERCLHTEDEVADSNDQSLPLNAEQRLSPNVDDEASSSVDPEPTRPSDQEVAESASVDSNVDSLTEPSEQADGASINIELNDLPIERSRNFATVDDASSQTKSRPTSGIEMCAPAGEVPVGKLMSIVMNLQTQLTQLMVRIKQMSVTCCRRGVVVIVSDLDTESP